MAAGKTILFCTMFPSTGRENFPRNLSLSVVDIGVREHHRIEGAQ